MKKAKTKPNKLRISYILKDLLLLLLVIVVYAVSVYLTGFSATNYKLLTIVFYGIVGFVGAVIIYGIVLGVLKLAERIKIKKSKNRTIKFIGVETEICENFSYNCDSSIKDNVSVFFTTLKNTLTPLANKYGHYGKYSYLSFTFEDAHEFIKTVVFELENTVDSILELPIINKFDLKNKPLSIVENKLKEVLEKENKTEENKDLKTKIVGKVLIKNGKGFVKNFINSKLNFVISYTADKASIIYLKNGKIKPKKLAKKVKNVESLEVVK
ncbi:MAG: hypothetical protein IKA85_05270 [Clostridia bacterium]|nr:hypothetical protein [Clostridia bacterium]